MACEEGLRGGLELGCGFLGERYYDVYVVLNMISSSINITFIINSYSSGILYLIIAVVIMIFLYAFYYLFFDPFIIKFFLFIMLFVKSMVFFSIAADFLTMYLTWECIGLFSFFLISFFWYRVYAIKAGFKAFTFGKLGDLSLFLAFTVLYFSSTTLYLPFTFIIQLASTYSICYFTIFILLCSFSKSTQFGMHIWLPDAMEGPIPVSALIHAATLVIAGMILLTFVYPVLEYWITYLYIIIIFMSLVMTLSSASVVGNFDIKRYIAFSTILQISTSFFTLIIIDINLGTFFFSFHMVYKSTLFIIAGVIVHATFSNQDLRILNTYNSTSTVLIRTLILLALFNSCSTWFTCGFYIKEFIINYANTLNNTSIYTEYVNLFTFCLLLTLFYSYFLIIILFYYTTSIGVFKALFYIYDFEICLFICGLCTLFSYILLFQLNEFLNLIKNYNIYCSFIKTIYSTVDLNIYILSLIVFFPLIGFKKTPLLLIYLDVCLFIYRILLFSALLLFIITIKLALDMCLFMFYIAINIQNTSTYFYFKFKVNYVLLIVPLIV